MHLHHSGGLQPTKSVLWKVLSLELNSLFYVKEQKKCDLELSLQSTCQKWDGAEQRLWSQLGTVSSFCCLIQFCSKEWACGRWSIWAGSPLAVNLNALLSKQQCPTYVRWSASCKTWQAGTGAAQASPGKSSCALEICNRRVLALLTCGCISSPGPLPWGLLCSQSKHHIGVWHGPNSAFSHTSLALQWHDKANNLKTQARWAFPLNKSSRWNGSQFTLLSLIALFLQSSFYLLVLLHNPQHPSGPVSTLQ